MASGSDEEKWRDAMTQFINSKEQLVTESLDGFLRVCGNPASPGLTAFPISK